MKKLILEVLVLSLSLSLAACGQKQDVAIGQETEVHTESQKTEESAEPLKETEETQQTQTVEITMDNYREYFELREAAEPYLNDDGTVESWDFFYGVFLKDEYIDRFVSGQVDFEIGFETQLREVEMEEGTGACIPGELASAPEEPPYEQKTCGMQDFRNQEGVPEKSDFWGTIAAQVYSGSIQESEDGILTAQLPTAGEILHAEGMLTLK